MNKEKFMPLAKGMIKHLPGVKKLLRKTTGGTIESRYCYSVWMRHLKNWNTINDKVPEIIAELGPGDSLGIGFAALLSGSKQIHSLDVVKYWDSKRNLKIFEELIELFKNRTNIPDNTEYPKVKPIIEDYSFPSKILSDNIRSNLEIGGVSINGEYTYEYPILWNAFPNEQWWINAYTYDRLSIYGKVLKHTIRNRYKYNTRINNITCGVYVEKHTAEDLLKWLKKCTKSASVDGYWLYPQMRMSKNCYWRLHPDDPYSKESLAGIPYHSFIDAPDDPSADVNFFQHLKEINEYSDKYRKKGWWFGIKRWFVRAFLR